MKRLILLALLAAGCAPRAPESAAFRWGGDATGGEPFLLERPGAQPGGFEGELAEYLGAKIGRTPTFVQRTWANLPEDLRRGDIDAAFNGMEWFPAREEVMASTVPYFVYSLRLIVRKDSPIKGWDDLRLRPGRAKVTVGVLRDTAAERYLKEQYADDVTVEAFDDEGVTGVMRKAVNDPGYATVQDAPAATWYLTLSREKDQFKTLHLIDKPVKPTKHPYYVLFVRKADTELRGRLNEAIGEGLRDGTFRRIYEKYDLWDAEQATLLDVGRDWPPAGSAERPPLAFFAWQLLLAARFTLLLAALSFPLAMALGLALALGRVYGPWPVRAAAVAYVELFRGTPLLLQLAVVYYLLPAAGVHLSAFAAGVVGLALNYAANEAEVFRAGLLAVPRGQTEAALSLGLSPLTALWRVVLPQAVRVVIPPVTNDFIALFKDTAVCSAIAVTELTARYRSFAVNNPSLIVELGLMTAGLYLLMSYPLSLLARRLEAEPERGNVHA
ncbi:MAG: ABC transporter permease subunit [Gemmataceae bacterium]